MIAISVDCEQWNSPELRGKNGDNNTFYSLEGNNNLLKIFKKYGVRATFFVTGFFAEEQKKQLKEIAKEHEIASHGYNHFYRGNKNLDLYDDISKSKKIIEKVIGKKVIGFRSPQMQYSQEIIHVLEKLKFKYDSSLHTAYMPGFYNNSKSSLKPFKVGKIIEVPATGSYSLKLPISWIFMRNLPLSYTIKIVKNLLKKGITPVIYVHSWEFTKVRDKNVPFYMTLKTGDKFCKKLERFLEIFRDEKFVTIGELANNF